jgi:hypothetical protein
LNVYKEDALLEFVFHPIHDFAVSTGILFCRARAAWVSAFFFSQLDVCSFPGPQLFDVIKSCASGKRPSDGVIAVSVGAEIQAAGVARSN